MSADLLTRLIEAGTPAALVAEVAMLAARAEAAVGDPVAERRREWDRQYRAEKRAAEKAARTDAPTMSGGSGGRRVDNADKADSEPAPAPPPLSSPQTPQQTPPPHPHPEVIHALTRGLAGIAVLIAGIEQLRTEAAAARKRRWPKDMPPPPGVSNDQWAGLIEHRKARRDPMTARAYDLLVAKLAKHADDEWPPGRLVDQIVERNWLTFEPHWLHRNTETRNGNRPHHRRTGNGFLDACIDG